MAADAAGNMSAWFALFGALGGVMIAGAVGLVTAVLNHRWQAQAADRTLRWEHTRQLRQERRETYAHYWRVWNSLIRELEEPLPGISTSKDVEKTAAERIAIAESEWRQAVDALFLICGKEVLDAGIVHFEVTKARIAAALQGRRLDGAGKTRALNRAMRRDILEPTLAAALPLSDHEKADKAI